VPADAPDIANPPQIVERIAQSECCRKEMELHVSTL
jgi:hypothetical protein